MRRLRDDPRPGRMRVSRAGQRRNGVSCRSTSCVKLRDCGLSPDQVTHRLSQGWLHRVYPAVYAVGHSGLSMEGRFLAAVKSVGGRAFLSRFSAALWEFVECDGRHPGVLVVRAGIKPRSGIRVHRASVLDRRDVMRHKGIPVTSPARTLVDLAAVANDKLLRTGVRRALASRRVSIRQLAATRRRLGPRRGAARLDRALQNAAPMRSELEDVLFDLIVDAGFVRPDVNKLLLLAGRRVVPDFRWPEQRIVVEADSRTWHENPIARADDAERQTLLEAHGDHVLRVTWTQAIGKPRDTVAQIKAAGVPRRTAAVGAVA
jgi:very-short-patch-repair endonuclease